MERKTIKRLVAGAGLAGLVGILPISLEGCMPARESQRQVYAPEEQRVYNDLKTFLKSNPVEFEQEDLANSRRYHEKGVKLNYLFSPKSPGEGRGRYVISRPEVIVAGYINEDKGKYCFGYNPGKKTIVLVCSETAFKYTFDKGRWIKSTAPFGKGEDIISEEDVNQNEHTVPDEEAMRFVEFGEKLRKIFPTK